MARSSQSHDEEILTPLGGVGRGRPGPLLVRSVVRELGSPTLVSLGGLTVAALTKNVLGYVDWIVNRGLGADVVAGVALHQLVPVVAQVLPFAALIGALVGLGRLRADSEVLALEASGVRPAGLIPAVLLASAIPALLGVGLGAFVAPSSRAALDARLQELAFAHPGALVRPGSVQRFGDRELLAREVSPDGTRLRGVLLWLPDLGEAMFAGEGRLRADGPGAARLVLEDAQLLGAPGGGGQHLQVERFETRLERSPTRNDAPGDDLAAASLAELEALAASAPDAASARQARAEWHRRFALPLAALVFGALAPVVALGSRSFSRTRGAVAGLGLTVVYYGLAQLGVGLLRFEAVPAALGAWLPTALGALVAAAGWMWLARNRFREPAAPRRESPGPRLARRQRSRHVLDRYVAGMFVGSAAVGFGALLAGYLIVDLLERLEWFARHGAGPLEVLHFYGARIWLLASRVLPLGLLAGSAFGVSMLAGRGELVAMESCGVRPLRGLAAFLVLSMLVAPVYLLLTDRIVPRTNAWADRIKVSKIEDREPHSETDIWYRSDDRLMRAARLGANTRVVRDLIVYELGPRGLPVSRVDARTARYVGDGQWELAGARRVAISERGVETAPAPTRLELGRAWQAARDPMHLSAAELLAEARRAEAGGYGARLYRVELHRKLAAPLACLLLPALAIPLALGGGGRPSLPRGLLRAGVVGIGYILVGDAAASLGYGGWLPAAAAGWGPPLLLAGIGLFGALSRRRATR